MKMCRVFQEKQPFFLWYQKTAQDWCTNTYWNNVLRRAITIFKRPCGLLLVWSLLLFRFKQPSPLDNVDNRKTYSSNISIKILQFHSCSLLMSFTFPSILFRSTWVVFWELTGVPVVVSGFMWWPFRSDFGDWTSVSQTCGDGIGKEDLGLLYVSI